MKWFGESWGSPLCSDSEPTETPVGAPCGWCEEIIVAGDSGLIIPHIGDEGAEQRPYHRACFLRSCIGSLGHQARTCSCFGGQMEDPPGLTKRQAAQAAAEYAEAGHVMRSDIAMKWIARGVTQEAGYTYHERR